MAVPAYETILNPMLRVLAVAGEELSRSRLLAMLAEELSLPPEDRELKLPSGEQTAFDHQVEWARCHLQMEGLVEGSIDSGLRLSARGWSRVLDRHPALHRSLQAVRTPSEAPIPAPASEVFQGAPIGRASQSDDDAILDKLRGVHDDLACALLCRVLSQSPAFFERLIVDLLCAMGYGGGEHRLARRLGQTGDNGVDGVVSQDALGLSLVYFQAKRYRADMPVPLAAVRDFVGALDGKRASQGVLFTTSFFPPSAQDYVSQSSFRVVLVDGRKLTDLMMCHDIGVRVKDVIKIKRIDERYFAV